MGAPRPVRVCCGPWHAPRSNGSGRRSGSGRSARLRQRRGPASSWRCASSSKRIARPLVALSRELARGAVPHGYVSGSACEPTGSRSANGSIERWPRCGELRTWRVERDSSASGGRCAPRSDGPRRSGPSSGGSTPSEPASIGMKRDRTVAGPRKSASSRRGKPWSTICRRSSCRSGVGCRAGSARRLLTNASRRSRNGLRRIPMLSRRRCPRRQSGAWPSSCERKLEPGEHGRRLGERSKGAGAGAFRPMRLARSPRWASRGGGGREPSSSPLRSDVSRETVRGTRETGGGAPRGSVKTAETGVELFPRNWLWPRLKGRGVGWGRAGVGVPISREEWGVN